MCAKMGKKCSIVANELRSQGNICYESHDYEDALHFYNQSLCFAEGESLSLAYANKASLSFKRQKFDECLKNIKLARDSIYPIQKMTDQDGRKFASVIRLESKLNQLEFLKLSYPANEKLPFIVDCLELKTNEKYGRHIITNKDLKVGDIVGIEKPSCIRAEEYIYNHCATCDTDKAFDLFPCSCCVKIMFCSKACKEEATKTFHRDEATNVVVGIVNSSLRRMAINMYCNAFTLIDNSIEDFQDHICVNDSGPRTIFDFDLSNPDETINDKNRLHAMFSLFGVNFSGTNNIECFQYFLKRVEMIVFKYTFLTFSQKLYGIYSFGSLLNHSCAPNVIVYQFEEKNVYFVVRPISKGQQLFVSYNYCYLYEAKEVRQEKLFKRFRFQCDCEACEGNYLTQEELKKANGDLTPIELPSWPDRSLSSTEVIIAIQRYKHYCALLQSSPELLVNNHDGVLITQYITTCLEKIIYYEPKML